MRLPTRAVPLFVALACLLPGLAAQKITEPRLGLTFSPPKGWGEMPGDVDRHATLRLFVAPRALTGKGEASHTPILRVMFFKKGGDAGKDVVDELPRTTPFRSLEDFAQRGLGAKDVAKEPHKVGTVEGLQLTGKSIPGERMLFGQTFPLDDGEAAICIEVLASQAEKLKKDIDGAIGSLQAVTRLPATHVEPPWVADAEWGKKDAAARLAVRRKWADELVAATAKNPESGYKLTKTKLWTVLSAADPAYTKKAIAAAEAAHEWLAKKLPDLTKEAPLPAVLRIFDNNDQYQAFLTTRNDSREYDAAHRELYCVNDRDNGGSAGWGQLFRAVLWQIFDDVDPAVLPALPRWFDNGCWEFLRSSKYDGKKLEFAPSDVERGRMNYYPQNKQDYPPLWDLIQEHRQPSPEDGKTDTWSYTPDCARLLRWFWLHDGLKAFDKPNLVGDYVKALAKAHDKRGADPTLDISTVGITESMQKKVNKLHNQWRDELLKDANNLALPLTVDAWKAVNEKWVEFNKNYK